jgi:hypothetical protein
MDYMKITINIDTNNTTEIQEAIQFLEAMIGQTPEANETTRVQTITQAASHQAHERITPQAFSAQETLNETKSADDILDEVKKEEPPKPAQPEIHVLDEEF